MNKSLIPLCVAALVAACSSYSPTAGLPPGGGFVVSVGVLPSARPTYRLLLRMDSGATRTVDLDDPTFFPDERVEVTSDGRVAHLSTFRLGAKS
jgi:hypothetical protein